MKDNEGNEGNHVGNMNTLFPHNSLWHKELQEKMKEMNTFSKNLLYINHISYLFF